MAGTVHGNLILESPNGQFRVELELADTAELKAHFHVNESGTWKEVQGADNPLARWRKDRLGWIRFQ